MTPNREITREAIESLRQTGASESAIRFAEECYRKQEERKKPRRWWQFWRWFE